VLLHTASPWKSAATAQQFPFAPDPPARRPILSSFQSLTTRGHAFSLLPPPPLPPPLPPHLLSLVELVDELQIVYQQHS
jgi:hypothetical protein